MPSRSYLKTGIGLADANQLSLIANATEVMRIEAAEITTNAIQNHAEAMGNSTKDPTTDAPADWVEIEIGGTTYFIPAYVA